MEIHSRKVKFLRGYSTVDYKTTRKLAKTIKMILEHKPTYKLELIESLIKLHTKSFFKIMDYKHSITTKTVQECWTKKDTGKDAFDAILEDIHGQLHWFFLRGLRIDIHFLDDTIFYDTSSDENNE